MMCNEQIDVRHIGIVAGTLKGRRCAIGRFAGRPKGSWHLMRIRKSRCILSRSGRTWSSSRRIVGRMWPNLLSQSSAKLAHAGAEFIVCPNNTLHRVFDAVRSPIPWLHIADVVAAEAFQQGSRRVGLLGTRSVMEGCVYRKKLERIGIDLEVPDAHDQARIHAHHSQRNDSWTHLRRIAV